jgi:2,5-dihydroxypyridine 5,6-dioxygenase
VRGEALHRAIGVLISEHLCVRVGETVYLTVDDATDCVLVDHLVERIKDCGARPSVLRLPRLPLQGLLSDPYIPASVGQAVSECDVWIDSTFPYLAGSTPFGRAMKNGRTRYLLLGDLRADGVARLYGSVDHDVLFDLQDEADRMLRDAQGQACRIKTPAGTDIEFRIGRPATAKSRHANAPGSQTVPGSAIFYPDKETVRGTIALEAAFHDHYERLPGCVMLEVDGRICRVGEGHHRALLDRALRRAAGGDYGHVIHFTIGLHPAAEDRGVSFIEDIRALGRNAVGLGLPWWEPGGGENHPDGVMTGQSLWIGGELVLDAGRPVTGHRLESLLSAVESQGMHRHESL